MTPEAAERSRIAWWLRAANSGPGGTSYPTGSDADRAYRQALLDVADVIEQHPDRFECAPTGETSTP